MKIKNIVPVVSVKDLAATKEFYLNTLGFEEVYKNEWYLHLRASGDERLEIGFVASNHPSQPALFQPAYQGKGVSYSIEVEDVDAEYARMKEKGVEIRLEKRDEPWGERHFAIADPNGVVINVSKTDPARRGQVDYRDHMMNKDRGVRA
jgi:catechol 2,3-dioxygenase-like lactoylglutathione lyase family enzyme